MIVQAHAKINLGLRILRRRNDGYHDIETLFHRIDLFDTIEIERAESGIHLTCSDPALPVDDGNLCVGAARRMLGALGVNAGIRMHLTKRIPHGAGLGGGSSDAAAVLRALPALLGCEADGRILRDVALSLGSDVPFFLADADAHAHGRGELLSYFTHPFPYSIVLDVPAIHVSTSWAYSCIRPKVERGDTLFRVAEKGWKREFFTDAFFANDFESVVLRTFPDISRIKDAFVSSGAIFAQLSGSGSAVFGVYDGPVPSNIVDAATTAGPTRRFIFRHDRE